MHRQIAGKLTGPITKWIVLLITLAATVGLGLLGTKLGDVKNNEATSWLPGSAEASKVATELSKDVDPNDIPTLVVYSKPSGLTKADLAAMDAQAAQIAKIDGVTRAGVLTPDAADALRAHGKPAPKLLSADRQVAYSYFTLNFGKAGWSEVPHLTDKVKDIAKIDGVKVQIGGMGGQAADFASSFSNSHSQMIFFTFLAVIVILLLTYRSPVLWILPIVSAAIAFLCAQGTVYLAAKYLDVTVNDQSQYILGILVIGAGTDYALLLVARYREELRNFEDRHEAMAHALHRAAPAVIASAATVALGLLCLTVADLNSTAGLGPVLAISVGVTLLVMVTFFPALLVACGRWVFWPKRPRYRSVEPTESGLWARVGARISKRPRAVWLVTAVILSAACVGLTTLDTSGLTTKDSFTTKLDSVDAQQLLLEHGLGDSSNKVQVVADDSAVASVLDALKGVDGLSDATAPKQLGNGRSWFEMNMKYDASSERAFDVIKAARAAADVGGGDALVGGTAGFYLDSGIASHHDNRLIMPMVLLVVLLVLMVLLRALVAPLLLILTVVLSFGAALGISALLFKYVFDFHGADPGFPLFAFVFLVALGVDYNIFLMTRVREETINHGTRKGSLVALSSTGGVITSAGLVLAATFLMLGTLPMVFLAELGTAVALGVALDTMIVRSVLVTALNLDLGDKIWWPSKLGQGAVSAPEPLEPVEQPV
ncbi:MMPL family transporter [Nocardioides montaniterrae]